MQDRPADQPGPSSPQQGQGRRQTEQLKNWVQPALDQGVTFTSASTNQPLKDVTAITRELVEHHRVICEAKDITAVAGGMGQGQSGGDRSTR